MMSDVKFSETDSRCPSNDSKRWEESQPCVRPLFRRQGEVCSVIELHLWSSLLEQSNPDNTCYHNPSPKFPFLFPRERLSVLNQRYTTEPTVSIWCLGVSLNSSSQGGRSPHSDWGRFLVEVGLFLTTSFTQTSSQCFV